MRRMAFFLMSLIMSLPAQLVIRVDSSAYRNAERSVVGAVALSALIPGLGQRYLGERERMRFFVSADVAAWSAVAVSWFAQSALLSSLCGYAERHAGISDPPRDPDFLDLLARYRSRDGVFGLNSNPDMQEHYNLAMIRSGKSADQDFPMDAAHSWDWGSSENPETTKRMREYNQLMRRYRIARIAFQVSLGAVFLNRLASVFDAIRIHRSTSASDLVWFWEPVWMDEKVGAHWVVVF